MDTLDTLANHFQPRIVSFKLIFFCPRGELWTPASWRRGSGGSSPFSKILPRATVNPCAKAQLRRCTTGLMPALEKGQKNMIFGTLAAPPGGAPDPLASTCFERPLERSFTF